MNENKLSEILIELRNRKGLTQKELAEKLNISDKAISRWETGTNLPTMDTLIIISRFYKVPLNDLIIARASSEEDGDDTVKDIIKEFSKMNTIKSRIIKIILAISLVIVTILTMTIIFTNSYNKFKVYKAGIKSDDFYNVYGVYVETRIRDSLYLSSPKLKKYILGSKDIVTMNLYYLENDEKKILQSYSSLDNIQFFSNDSYIKIDNLSDYFDRLYLEIEIINSKGETTRYEGKLEFKLDFSNNKIYEDDNYDSHYKNDISVDKIKNILLENGFEETVDNMLWKGTDKYKINYIVDLNKININFNKSGISYRYEYSFYEKILHVKIFNKENIEIENYEYDVINKKIIECITGSCNSYDEAMDILNDKVLNLIYK